MLVKHLIGGKTSPIFFNTSIVKISNYYNFVTPYDNKSNNYSKRRR
jgi:hypothetical protein